MTPELKWPTTKWMPSPRKLLATETPWRGSAASSPTISSICWPLMPPAALMSATACSTPFLQLRAERRVRAGHRPRDAQLQLLRSAVTAGEHGDERERQRGKDGG